MGKLIYSIVSVPADPETLNSSLTGIKGVLGADLHAISFNDISAIVSDISNTEKISDRPTALEFADVIERLGSHFTLLPVRFGSIFESTDSIIKTLQINYQEICQNLKKVENRQEFGLKVFCNTEKLKAEFQNKIEADSISYGKADTIVRNSVSMEWMNAKLKEHRLEEMVLKYVDSVISDISSSLNGLNAIIKFNKMITPTIIVDALFLLEKDKKDVLVDAIKILQGNHPFLHLVLTGPWQPYSFVDITVKG
jgi:hypothetical protein